MIFRLGVLGAILAGTIWSAAPVVQSAVNAASRLPAGLPSSGLAQGALVTITGTHFGTGNAPTVEYPLPTSFEGTKVTLAIGEETYSTFVYSIKTGQEGGKPDEIVVLLPSTVPTGDATLKVTVAQPESEDVSVSEEFPVKVVDYAFGIFTQDQSGSGSGIVVDAETGNRATLLAAFVPKQKVVLTGTGLGAVTYDEANAAPGAVVEQPADPAPTDPDQSEPAPSDPPPSDPPPSDPPPSGDEPPAEQAPSATDTTETPAAETPAPEAPQLEVWVGSKAITPTLSERAPGKSIDQITFELPEEVTGCYVPVFVRRGSVTSNVVSIPVAATADGGPCTDSASGVTAEDLQKLAELENVSYGVVELSRVSTQVTAAGFTVKATTDVGSGAFYKVPAAQYFDNSGIHTTVGACTLFTYSANSDTANPAATVMPVGLDAGATIDITGPKGKQQLKRDAKTGLYSASLGTAQDLPSIPGLPNIPGLPVPTAFMEPGTFTVSSGGGEDIKSFNTGFNIPAMFSWTNQADLTSIPRGADLEVKWANSDANGYVSITGFSVGDIKNYQAAAFTCLAKGSDNSFVVPAAILQALPVTATEQGTVLGSLAIGMGGNHVKIDATGCDMCFAGYSAAIQQTVTYK